MRVLIAEDDPVIGMALAQRVRSLGHEALGPVGDGEQAVEAAHANPPDIYLFDIDMPNLDGLAAARRLADEDLRRPVVVVTGVEDTELIDRCIESGVSAYLSKPIGDRELEAAIRLAASRHAEFEELEAEVGRARQALADRKTVERAKAILMDVAGLGEPEAFRRIQQTARKRNMRLADVAAKVIEQEELLRQGD